MPTPTPTPTPSASTAPTIDVYPGQSVGAIVKSAPNGYRVLLHAGTYGPFGIYRSNVWVDGDGAIVSGGASHVVDVNGASNVTITNLTIQNAPTTWGAGLYIQNSSAIIVSNVTLRWNHSFGLKVVGSTDVKARFLDVYGNDTGSDCSGNLSGFELTDSQIHDQSSMVVDGTSGARGANATNFYHATGPILVARNSIWNNRAVSTTYGNDGGAFEIYGSSGITYTENVVWDNENVMETGTDALPNAGITFTRNVLYNPAVSTAPVAGPSEGLILRGMQNALFANNTFVNLDGFAFLTMSGAYSAGIANSGVQFVNNIVQATGSKAYSIDTVAGLTLDHNVLYVSGGYLGYLNGRGNTSSLATWQSWTGNDGLSKQANPQFADAEYQLLPGSPAIDAGAIVPGVTDGYDGSLPDIGRWEW